MTPVDNSVNQIVGFNEGVSSSGGVGNTVVNPATITGLSAWYKADSLGLGDGTAVSSWTDASGNGRHAVQATGGFQPIYKTGILNGLSVVRFDGVDDTLVAVCALQSARTIFCVAKLTGAAGSTWRVWALGGANTATLRNFFGAWQYDNNQAGSGVSLGGNTANFSYLTIRYNSTASTDGYLANAAPTNFDPTDTYSATTAFNISSTWAGDIAEILVYDVALSASDVSSLQSYLANKYAL